MTDQGGALSPYRVVDLTTTGGWLCGKLLADLGADVLKVEPPGGDPGRQLGRFVDGREGDPEANLEWWFAGAGKRSVVLDLDDDGDRDQLEQLLAGADVLIESFGPGGLEERNLAVDQLLARHPHLVVTSISPFGLDGPYRDRPGPDLVVSALGGQVWLNGDEDRPPVRISAPQTMRVAAAEAAVHTVVALQHAARTGQGQHVDVSAQAATVRTLMNATEFKVLQGTELTRAGSKVAYSPFRARMVYACADGHVTYMPALGSLAGPGLEWMRSTAQADGLEVPELLREANLCDLDLMVSMIESGRAGELMDATEQLVESVVRTRTKAELYRAAVEHLLLLAPVNTVVDLREDLQLAARDFWREVRAADGSSYVAPGPWARLSATPLLADRRAPLVGEHTAQVLGAIRERPRSEPAEQPGQDPFAGLKVWDMSWVGVGPLTARYLADYGATVIRMDNTVRIDVLRVNPPFLGGQSGVNRSQFYADFNASKMGLGLDLGNPAGREVALRLVEWCDVTLESFTPKTLHGFGLDYEVLREVNPSVVMLSTCMQGQTGPNRNYRGFGQLMGSLTGFYEVTGWPDRDPTMVYGAYTDFLCQRMCATALISALDHRRRTGEGQHIDVSQFEAALQFLGPELLDYELNGFVATRMGNRDPYRAPHGVYPCRPEGEGRAGERWVAIACETDEQWRGLAKRVGLPDWADEDHLGTVAGRKEVEDRLDAHLADWTRDQAVGEVVRQLEGCVPVGEVLTPDALHDDPQLRHRGYFETLEHSVMGPQRYNGMQARLSATPGRLRKAAPCLGEDTFHVLNEILGYDEDEAVQLLVSEAVEINAG
jgi:crotonobetainyl-CoA:carnitine CoA-transferase CaiB-like acyl-CoA transferase